MNALCRNYVQEHYPKVWKRLVEQAVRLTNADKVLESLADEEVITNA